MIPLRKISRIQKIILVLSFFCVALISTGCASNPKVINPNPTYVHIGPNKPKDGETLVYRNMDQCFWNYEEWRLLGTLHDQKVWAASAGPIEIKPCEAP